MCTFCINYWSIYWSSNTYNVVDDTSEAYYLYALYDEGYDAAEGGYYIYHEVFLQNNDRCYGQPIRPVKDPDE